MTNLVVSPDSYYAAARQCFSIADEFATAAKHLQQDLDGTAAMAGSFDLGVTWGRSYDSTAHEAFDVACNLVDAVHNYGELLTELGFNYAVAEAAANIESVPPPVKPSVPTAPQVGSATLPSAVGGHGTGLLDDFLGLVDKIGVPVPDGDTEKLDTAASAWTKLAECELASLDQAIREFSTTESPDADFIDEDLRDLVRGIEELRNTFRDVGKECSDYRAALNELRTTITGILEDLAIELAATAVIGIAASFISFGAGAVAATAKAAHSLTKFGRTIAEAIAAWKITKTITRGFEVLRELKWVRATAERIKSLGKKDKAEREQRSTPEPAVEATQPSRITGLTGHGRQQMLERDGHGVTEPAMEDAVANPVGGVEHQSNGGWKFIGEDATVVLNDKGQVVTTWPNNRNGWRTP